MFEIQNKSQLKTAYELLAITNSSQKISDEKKANVLAELKKDIRRYLRQNSQKLFSKYIAGDYDGYTELKELPSDIKDIDSAWEYFDYNANFLTSYLFFVVNVFLFPLFDYLFELLSNP